MRSETEEWELEDDYPGSPEDHPRPQRRLPTRRSRRNRARKTGFGFGHFMLPIVGLVAVGILVLGVRLFFFPSSREETVNPGEEPAVAVQAGVQEGSAGTTANEGGEIIAVPEGTVPAKKEPEPVKKATPEKTETKPATRKTASSQPALQSGAPSVPKPPATQAKPAEVPVTGLKWGVQVGAFKERTNAEKLVKKLKEEGFVAKLSELKSGETVLTKVFVVAGEQRVDADKLSMTLQEKGYPVLVVKLD